MKHAQSDAIFKENRERIPGGVVSMNRLVDPQIAFVHGKGAHLWDADGRRYIDYHAAFGPYLLGHNDPEVEQKVREAQDSGWTLTGTGTTPWEGEAAALLMQCVPSLERVVFTNTGSEATALAIRLARAATGREHILLMQGGYNGWQDDVACNVMTPLDQLGPRQIQGEYPWRPLSAGIPEQTSLLTHVIEFNSLEAMEWAFETYPTAALLMEPILQNIGVVKPDPGYLAGVRRLCDKYGVVWIGDEVKTGFRHGLSGYHKSEGVRPDLLVFGKAIANGYPVGALGGRREILDLFTDPDPVRRVLIAGTYSGHPIPMAAAIATMSRLLREGRSLYDRLDALTESLTKGILEILIEHGPAIVSRQCSAFCPYFMDHAPRSWHDLAENHDMAEDAAWRKRLIDQGIYAFPVPTKQWSVSSAHTEQDIAETLEAVKITAKS